MRSRGYGIKGRTHYSNFRFDRRDGWVLSGLCALIVLICIGAAMGENTVAFFPVHRRQAAKRLQRARLHRLFCLSHAARAIDLWRISNGIV